MEWFWTAFNLVCGLVGLAGFVLAVIAEARSRSVRAQVRRVVERNRRMSLAQEIFAAIGDGKLVLAASERPVQMLHLDRMRDIIVSVQASRDVSIGDQKSLQRLAADLARINAVTPESEPAIWIAIDDLTKLRRRLNDSVTEPSI